MPAADLVDATDLEHWADRREAQGRLPQLTRRLILATTDDISRIRFRSGEGVAYEGWDGIVESPAGSFYVPAGSSVWEMGTNRDPRKKAEDDYNKRTAHPLGLASTEAAFVFVTPRRWAGKDAWVAKKMRDGKWREVRAYDADDLETWLETALGVHVWISGIADKSPDGIRDLETHWIDWADASAPAFSPDLLIAGIEREEAAQHLVQQLVGPPAAFSVQRDSVEEALAFVAASIQRLTEVDRGRLFARALVVDDRAAWRRLIASDRPLLLVPLFDGASTAPAIRAGHTVVIPAGREAVPATGTIELPRLRRAAAKDALRSMGLTEDRAEALATLARRSLLSLRRTLAGPEVQQPAWARPNEARAIVPAMLAGEWDEAFESDRASLASLAGQPYDQIEQDMRKWANASDPPVRQIGTTWLLASREDAWSLLSRYLTVGDCQRFENVAHDVLGQVGSSRLPFASGDLRKGTAATLALMAIRGASLGGVSGQDRAANIVRRLLSRANADDTGVLWASLSDVLPLLSEAAPDAFIDAVDAGLSGGTPVLASIFDSAKGSGALYGGWSHTGLLWALENLAWNPDYLGLVASLLARLTRLARLGPTVGNRPDGSLRSIFLLWLPQTAASLDRRLTVLDSLRAQAPEVAWNLLIALLPQFHDIGGPRHAPLWRDWKPELERRVTQPEWLRAIHEIVGRLLSDVGIDGARWHQFIERIGDLPSDERDIIIGRLAAADPTTFDEPSVIEVRDALRGIISHHRQVPTADWAMPSGDVDRLAEVYVRFEPRDSSQRNAWLFSSKPRLLDVKPGESVDFLSAVEEARDRVVRDTYKRDGLRGILELATRVERPRDLGWTLGKAKVLAAEELDVLSHLTSPDAALRWLADGYVRGRSWPDGLGWADTILKHAAVASWTSHQRGEFLAGIAASDQLFDLVEQFDEETRRTYWQRFTFLGPAEPSMYTRAVTNLIKYGFPYAAIDLLGIYANQVVFPPDLVADALEAAAEMPFDSGADMNMLIHNVAELLDYLAKPASVDESRLASIEWAYLSLLYHRRPARLLHRELARDPAFFVNTLSVVFKAHNEESSKLSEEESALSIAAYELLKSWHEVPGRKDDGSIDAEVLAAWVTEAREMLAARDRATIGDHMIGQVLCYAPPDQDGVWPNVAVRDLLEKVAGAELERGLEIAARNRRGVTTRGLTDGGVQERSLADRYSDHAQALSDRWPRTGFLLRTLARTYENDAQREDTRADFTEDTWS